MPSLQQTKEQERAATAWDAVDRVSEDFKKQYGTIVKKLPMLILTNGLGQALAFLLAKGTPKKDKPPTKENLAHMAAYDHLSAWVMSQMQPNSDLMEWVRTKSSTDYRRATTEALAFLNWLTRFVEAAGLGAEEKAHAPEE